jgi:hypothetical protein
MGRKISDIYDQIAAEKASMSQLDVYLVDEDNPASTLDNTQTLLNDLSTPSKVGVWRLLLWVVAFGIWVHETVWDDFLAVVIQMIESAEPSTDRWYQKETLRFQYGYDLTWNGNKYVYTSIDASAKIIEKCAIQDNGGIVRVKVKKNTPDGILSVPEATAVNAYLEQIKVPGTNILLVNFAADEIRHQIDVYYNPQIPIPILQPACISAIEGYYNNLDFDGRLVKVKLIDALQKVNGVEIPVLNAWDIQPFGGTFNSIGQQAQTLSGHCKVSSAFPLTGDYLPGIPALRFIPYQ